MLSTSSFLNTYYRTVIVLCIILTVSLLPGEDVEKLSWLEFPFMDKIVHLGMYLVLTFFMILDNHGKSSGKFRTIVISILISLLYGILMEALQMILTNSRSAEYFDVAFNFAGSILAGIIWIFLWKFKSHKIVSRT